MNDFVDEPIPETPHHERLVTAMQSAQNTFRKLPETFIEHKYEGEELLYNAAAFASVTSGEPIVYTDITEFNPDNEADKSNLVMLQVLTVAEGRLIWHMIAMRPNDMSELGLGWIEGRGPLKVDGVKTIWTLSREAEEQSTSLSSVTRKYFSDISAQSTTGYNKVNRQDLITVFNQDPNLKLLVQIGFGPQKNNLHEFSVEEQLRDKDSVPYDMITADDFLDEIYSKIQSAHKIIRENTRSTGALG